MKIVKKENLGTTFNKIEIGECFKTKGDDTYYMRTSPTTNPITDAELNSIDLSNGSFDYFIASQKVIKVDCELHVKGEEK